MQVIKMQESLKGFSANDAILKLKEHIYHFAFLAAFSNRDQCVIFASYLILCKAEPRKCSTVSNLFDLGLYFVSVNNLLVESGDYTLVILELFGGKKKKSERGDSLLSSYCSNISVMHH